mgnify:CR=1 FL=1
MNMRNVWSAAPRVRLHDGEGQQEEKEKKEKRHHNFISLFNSRADAEDKDNYRKRNGNNLPHIITEL